MGIKKRNVSVSRRLTHVSPCQFRVTLNKRPFMSKSPFGLRIINETLKELFRLVCLSYPRFRFPEIKSIQFKIWTFSFWLQQ